jgi:hypothetical protein
MPRILGIKKWPARYKTSFVVVMEPNKHSLAKQSNNTMSKQGCNEGKTFRS